jgi:YggT family protein
MAGPDIWWGYWYFHLPNYALAALLYTMFGRFALGLVVGPGSPNYVWRWFCRLSDPVLRPVAFITPTYVEERFLPLAAAFWLALLRLAFFLALYAAGLAPRVAPAA